MWYWGPGILDAPHHPTVLDEGRVLVFDNGMHRGYSRLLEVDPRSNEIVWEYRADPPESFFTAVRGSSQRLPNGNTLVTEADHGRVFEITREGEIVWEFFNPILIPADSELVEMHDGFRPEITGEGLLRETIYRATRVVEPQMRDLLARRLAGALR